MGREAGEPSLNTYRHAGNLFTGVMEHANCAAHISLSVSGKLTCDDSSMGFSLKFHPWLTLRVSAG